PAASRQGVASVWRAIDAARKESGAAHRPESIRLRAPGRVLFEKRAAPRSGGARKGEGGKGSVEPAGGSGV
ncbi:MAG: hypothetical protein WCB19_02245, partial [Thermoplasmata archaeon]